MTVLLITRTGLLVDWLGRVAAKLRKRLGNFNRAGYRAVCSSDGWSGDCHGHGPTRRSGLEAQEAALADGWKTDGPAVGLLTRLLCPECEAECKAAVLAREQP